ALSGVFEMSKTWTMFACWRYSESRASSRNIEMNFGFLVRLGRMRLMATFFLNPSIDSATPRNTSAMPPWSSLSVMVYRSRMGPKLECDYSRGLRRTAKTAAPRVFRSSRGASAGRADPPGSLLGRPVGLALLAGGLAFEAQCGPRPGHQPLEPDRLGALLALVDPPLVEPLQGLLDLADQEGLPVVQPELRRVDLLLGRLVH